MQEEFHGIKHEDATYTFKLLYGWNRLNANIWLPSLSELVGIISAQDAAIGCYFSAMQGINLSDIYNVDVQGGSQFAYFQQVNATGGGTALWVLGGSEQFWLRSTNPTNEVNVWHITNTIAFHTDVVTSASHAVHPAVSGHRVKEKGGVMPPSVMLL